MNALAQLKPHKLTVDEVLSLVDSGAFDGLPRMELLDGTLYEMSPQRSEHVFAKNELCYRLRRALEAMASPLAVLVEPTVRITETTAAEPDVAVLTQSRVDGFYQADMMRLAVEISSTTIRVDMGFKRDLYARAGIPEYWVCDLKKRCVHQFGRSVAAGYPDPLVIPFGDDIVSIAIAGLIVSTSGLI